MIRGQLGFCVLLVLTGCGRFGFDPVGVDPGDAGPRDAGPADVPADACAFGAWSGPQAVAALNTTLPEYGGQITADGLAYYFGRAVTALPDVFVARRTSRTAPFGTAQRINELSSGAGDSGPTLRDDELEMYFDSFRTGSFCVHRTGRATLADAWAAPAPVAALCAAESVGPYLTADGLRLYYNTIAMFQRGTLMMATRATRADAFGPGSAVAGAWGAGRRGFPALTADELTIYFEFDSTGPVSLRQATRVSPKDPFGGEQPLAMPLNNDDTDPSITADGRELYFASSPAGQSDIHVATRSCL